MNNSTSLQVLVVGCGGLGTEVIKLLVAMKIYPTILDYDVVETSNLNRQFYFVQSDSKKFKAEVIGHKTGCLYKICKIEDISNEYLHAFDMIFSCLDSVASRMELNYLFITSTSKILVDCGVEGTKLHVKKVAKPSLQAKQTSCLYCIKDIYNTKNDPFLCSLANLDVPITVENRNKILNSLIFKLIKGDPNNENKEGLYKLVYDTFNKNASHDLQTSIFEIEGIAESIIPNTCFFNSMCASIAVIFAFKNTCDDYIFYDGAHDSQLKCLTIDKDDSCFVCKGND